MEYLKSDLKIIQSYVSFSIKKQIQHLEKWVYQTFQNKKNKPQDFKYEIMSFYMAQPKIFKKLTLLQENNSNIKSNQFLKIIKLILSILKQKITTQKLKYNHDYQPYCASKGTQIDSKLSEDDESYLSNEEINQSEDGVKLKIKHQNFEKQTKEIEKLKRINNEKFLNFLIVKYKVYIQRIQKNIELQQEDNQFLELRGLKQLTKLLQLCKKIILNDQFISYSLQISVGKFFFKSIEVLDHNYNQYGFSQCDISGSHDCYPEFPDHTTFFDLDISQKSHLIETIQIQLDGVYNYYGPCYTGSFPNIQINSPYSNIIVDYIENEKLNIDLSLIKIISCKKIEFKIYKIENIIKSFDTDLEIFNQQIEITIDQECSFQEYHKLYNLIKEKTSKEPSKIVDICIHDNFQNWIPQKYDKIDRITTEEQQFYDIIKDSQSLDQFFAKKAFLIFDDEELNIGIHTILQILVLQKFQNILSIQMVKLLYFLIDANA